MLDCLEVDIEVLDVSMETIGSSEYKKLLEINNVTNGILAITYSRT